jgi:hypothetical protein
MSTNPFESLPQPVLNYLFQFLDPEAANIAMRVCKKWKTQIESIPLAVLSKNAGIRIIDKVFWEKICNPQKQGIDLNNEPPLSLQDIRKIVRKMHQLQESPPLSVTILTMPGKLSFSILKNIAKDFTITFEHLQAEGILCSLILKTTPYRVVLTHQTLCECKEKNKQQQLTFLEQKGWSMPRILPMLTLTALFQKTTSLGIEMRCQEEVKRDFGNLNIKRGSHLDFKMNIIIRTSSTEPNSCILDCRPNSTSRIGTGAMLELQSGSNPLFHSLRVNSETSSFLERSPN